MLAEEQAKKKQKTISPRKRASPRKKASPQKTVSPRKKASPQKKSGEGRSAPTTRSAKAKKDDSVDYCCVCSFAMHSNRINSKCGLCKKYKHKACGRNNPLFICLKCFSDDEYDSD